jgi:hypothetical protein
VSHDSSEPLTHHRPHTHAGRQDHLPRSRRLWLLHLPPDRARVRRIPSRWAPTCPNMLPIQVRSPVKVDITGSFLHIVCVRAQCSPNRFLEPLREYVLSGKPFFGVCIGMQCLFEGSEEAPGMAGLGIVPGMVRRFQVSLSESVSQVAPGCARHAMRPSNTRHPLSDHPLGPAACRVDDLGI